MTATIYAFPIRPKLERLIERRLAAIRADADLLTDLHARRIDDGVLKFFDKEFRAIMDQIGASRMDDDLIDARCDFELRVWLLVDTAAAA